MATENQELKPSGALQTLQGISEKPIIRQMALMIGIAASVALGAAVILWSQSPEYTVLYAQTPETQLAEISNSLTQQGIDYKIDAVSGKVMVAASQIDQARISLSSQGLHKVTPKGFEMLNQEQGFGTSQFIQSARYHKALEEELALSIVSMSNIKNARVHLAIPKQSVFVRDRKKPSASVVLQLLSGRSLSKQQTTAITNMISASVEDLEVADVNIVDQMGRLLTEKDDTDTFGLDNKKMQYTEKLEDGYNEKVSNILKPFLGKNGFSVQVKANLDFNLKEVTSEQYNPDLSAIRSKQQLVEKTSGDGSLGIPGSLSNQPPGGSVVPETLKNADGSSKTNNAFRSSESLTENFEVDKSISHVKYSTGVIKQLSVAVVVDDKKSVNENGEVVSTPRTAEEIQRITSLVKEAVGYNIQRGDTVNVVNAAFVAPEALEALPEKPIWEQSWFMSVVKQVLAGLFVLYLLFGIIKPAFKNLSKPYAEMNGIAADGSAIAGGVGADGTDVAALTSSGGMAAIEDKVEYDADGNPLPTADDKYQTELELARKLVLDDPKVSAQVIKNWVK